jgi:glucose/arabinose dehydrogenase
VRLLGAALCAVALFVAGCSSGGQRESSAVSTDGAVTGLHWQQVAGGLESPVGLSSTPTEPNRLYIVEQTGVVRVLEGDKLLSKPFLDIGDLVVSGGEQGLLSLAFDPGYAANHLFYVDYTDTNGDTRVVEYEASPGANPTARRQLLFVDQPYANHNGGQLAFGPDGRLYVGMGDGGSGGDPENRAQDLSQKLGKLLSIDPHGQGGWRIEGYGLRNPWRFSFDGATGDLWIGDVGQGSWEEIDHTPRSSPGLENYGWNVYEGTHIYEQKDLNPAGHLVMPVYEYGHDHGCSVTGGYVYRGDAFPGLRGQYFFGDYCSGTIWRLRLADGKATRIAEEGHVDSLSSFGESAAGELFAASLEGKIYRLGAG